MNKIDELAKEYADKIAGNMGGFNAIYYAYMEGNNALMSLPLTDRLTDAEKERIRKMYYEELGMAQHFHLKAKASNDISCRQHYYGLREPYNISRMKLLERIFGSGFFKEGE